jgi:hypothetical protein
MQNHTDGAQNKQKDYRGQGRPAEPRNELSSITSLRPIAPPHYIAPARRLSENLRMPGILGCSAARDRSRLESRKDDAAQRSRQF